MSVTAIANDLVALCKEGKFDEATEKHYAADIVSIEAAAAPGMPAEMKGIDAIKAKGQWFMDNHEIHSATVNGPYIAENQFAVEFKYDVTNKPSGKRMAMEEMALYTVKGDKIVHERFYYVGGE